MKISIFLTKLIHISLVAFVVMFLGMTASKNMNSLYIEHNNKKKKKTSKLFLNMIIFSALIYISHYFIRNIVEFLNQFIFSYLLFWTNYIEYDTNRLKELGGGIAMATSVFLFMDLFKSDLKEIFNKRINVLIFNRNSNKKE